MAIVGARECSPYGRQLTKEFAKKLASAGAQIISGMAKGIDGAGQIGALEEGGDSYGVLGCGVDVCYPREHIELYTELERKGGILSEQPIGTKPLPQFFPARNRIISGLSDIVLVMEAKERSGSLITADMALEQGKDIYALPGPINSQLSRGCNRLIKQGAGILLSPEDLLEELSFVCEEKVKKLTENKIALESPENLVYSCLDLYPKNLNELADLTGLTIPALMDVLVSRFITNIGNVRTGEPRSLAGKKVHIYSIIYLDRAQMHTEYFFTFIQVGQVYMYLTVKTSGTE